MRIAVSTNDAQGLDSTVCAHFGHSPYFVFVDLDENGAPSKIEATANPHVQNHSCGAVVSFVSQHGANVMLSGGMGAGALGHFRAVGIDVFTGARGTVREALAAYQAQELPGNEANCHEHGGGCH